MPDNFGHIFRMPTRSKKGKKAKAQPVVDLTENSESFFQLINDSTFEDGLHFFSL